MARTDLRQVSCLVAVPARDVRGNFALLYCVGRAPASPAFALEECFCQFPLALAAPRAVIPGWGGALITLAGPRGIPLYRVGQSVTLFLTAFGAVPALCFLPDELPRDCLLYTSPSPRDS